MYRREKENKCILCNMCSLPKKWPKLLYAVLQWYYDCGISYYLITLLYRLRFITICYFIILSKWKNIQPTAFKTTVLYNSAMHNGTYMSHDKFTMKTLSFLIQVFKPSIFTVHSRWKHKTTIYCFQKKLCPKRIESAWFRWFYWRTTTALHFSWSECLALA